MYQKFYKLSGKPFQLTPDPRMLFPSSGHRRAMSYLLYGLTQGEGFVVITGDVGTGKTLLIQALFADISDRNLVTARLAAANLDADGVLPMVCAAFGLPYEGKSKTSLLQELERALRYDPDYNTGALLVVDEAQTMTAAALEELRVLSNLEVDGRALMQVFLVGQTELRDIVRQPKMAHLRQRVIASFHLEPLNEEETRNYIEYRLAAVGWDKDPDLAPEVFREAYRWSGGIPRRINLFMDRTLLFGYLEELHEIDASHVETVVREMREEIGGGGSVEEVDESADSEFSEYSGVDYTRFEALEQRFSDLEETVSLLLDVSLTKEFEKLAFESRLRRRRIGSHEARGSNPGAQSRRDVESGVSPMIRPWGKDV